MTIELNDNLVLPYQEFYGENRKQMPKLIADGRVPLSVAGLMERRLRATNSVESWRDNYFDTGDAFAYHPDGKFKIVLDAQPLREITPESRLSQGALILADGMYETLQGVEFTRTQLADILDDDLEASKVKEHPVWKALARDDTLLNEYIDVMFADMKARFEYDDGMGVYLEDQQTVPTLRAAFVYWLENGSQLYGDAYLDYVDGRFAGVAPEALSAPNRVIQKPSLELALRVVNEHLQAGKVRIH